MSGNCGDDDDNDRIANISKKLETIATFFQEKFNSKDTEYGKIFGAESDVSFLKTTEAIQKLLIGIRSLGILPDQLQVYIEGTLCILHMANTIINMESIIALDEKLHKDRITRIRIRMEDITAKVKKYSGEVENLGSLLMEIITDDDMETKQKKLEIFDFNFETLTINIEFCVKQLIVIKAEIHKGLGEVDDGIAKTEKTMADVQSVGWSAVTLGGITYGASGSKRSHNEASTKTDENAESGKGASWGEIIGGAIAIVGGIAMAGSALYSWIESNKAAQIKKKYEELTFDVTNLELELAQLKELMENHRRRQPNVQ